MNPKVVSVIARGVLGFGVSAVIGYTIKSEAKIAVVVDEFIKNKLTK